METWERSGVAPRMNSCVSRPEIPCGRRSAVGRKPAIDRNRAVGPLLLGRESNTQASLGFARRNEANSGGASSRRPLAAGGNGQRDQGLPYIRVKILDTTKNSTDWHEKSQFAADHVFLNGPTPG